MASLTCPACGAQLDGGAFACPNGHPRPRLGSTRKVADPVPDGGRSCPDRDGTLDDARPSANTLAVEPSPPTREPSAECNHAGNPEGRIICVHCNRPIADGLGSIPAHTWVVELPWGRQALVPGAELEIGREVGPFVAMIEPITTVSRRHATFRVDGDHLYVIDHASTNGTFCNGDQVSPRAERELHDGDVVQLSSRLRVVVAREDAR